MDTLDQLLGVDPAVSADADALVPAEPAQPPAVQGEVVETPAEKSAADIKDVEDDFAIARKAIKEALEKVQPVLDSAILVAQSGDEPRAYEVVGGLMGSIVDASKKLLEIHEKRKKVKTTDAPAAPAAGTPNQTVNIDRAVFVGRASDLLREIKRLQKGAENASEE